MRTDMNRAMAWRETLVLSFLLMCGFIQCLKDGSLRHVCRESNDSYDCILRHVFIDNLNNAVLFGYANQQWNYQSRLTFKNSTIRSLPRSLVDTYKHVELLNLERLQIETIEPFALANGQKIKKLFLSNNNIASLDEGVFGSLNSLEKLLMDGNQLASLPVRLFQNTSNLRVISMAGNNLQRIEDGTFQNNPNLENVNVANNRLVHFDLSRIPSLYEADVKNNLLQELNIPDEMSQLDASNNQIHSVVSQLLNWVEILNLSHNKLNTVGWLKPFKQLQSLDLSFNEIEDITSTEFKQLVNLTTLKLNNNRLFTFNMQSPSSRSLQILDLSHNSLVCMDNNLKAFEQLEELYLDHNSIVNVNLETLRKLSNLTLSHNDWDCAKLANLVSNLPTTTVLDYNTTIYCKKDYQLVHGICCTASDKPYHDRLIKYIAEVSAYERYHRNNARCSGDTVYDTVNNITNEIASSGPPPSPMLAKEVQDLKLAVQQLEQRNSEHETLLSKIDDLIQTHNIFKHSSDSAPESLKKVFAHLNQRQNRKKVETVQCRASSFMKMLDREYLKKQNQKLHDVIEKKNQELDALLASITQIID